MGVSGGSKSTGEGLVFYIDPANARSYSGIGNTIYDLVNTSIGGTFINGALIDASNNRSIYIDGVNDYVAFPVNTSLNLGTGDFTVNVWLRASSVAYYGTIFALDNTSQGNGILMYTELTTGTFRTWCAGVTKVGTTRICTNAWTQVTLTRTSGTCRQYVNGVLDESYSAPNGITANHNLRMGYPYIDNYPYFGYFGHTQVYNRALSASEILDQYNRNIKKYLSSENIITNGLLLNYDAGNPNSYAGTGVTINNVAGVGSTGILTNGPTFSQLNGGIIYFDGSNDYIQIINEIPPLSTFTIDLWVNSAVPADGHRIIFDGYYTFRISILSGKYMVGAGDGTNWINFYLYSARNPIYNTWEHICWTWDGSKSKLYLNGVFEAEQSSAAFSTVTREIRLAGFVQGGYNWNGKLSTSKIYNRALSSSEVLQNYNATKNRYIKVLPPIADASLVLNLDASSRASYVGTGTTWYDLSGNNLNGTLVNGPTISGTGISASILFDGSNDYVSIADNAKLNTFSAMTLEVIVRYTTTNSQIFAQKWNYTLGNDGYTLEILNSAIVAACYSAGNSYLSVSISGYPINNVYHMIFTLSGNTQTLYINGVSVASNSGGSVPNISGTTFAIGNRSNLSGTYFGGNVYLTKFYNRALTASEILQNFNFYRTRYGI